MRFGYLAENPRKCAKSLRNFRSHFLKNFVTMLDLAMTGYNIFLIISGMLLAYGRSARCVLGLVSWVCSM